MGRRAARRAEANASQPALDAALAALRRPLDFAARDDFAHLDRIQNLEQGVRNAAGALLGLSIPEDLQRYFEGLREDFSKPLEAVECAEKVAEALRALGRLEQPGWRDALLARATSVLPGVGPKRSQSLAQRGLCSVGDLLFHLPSGYEDRRSLSRIDELEVGRRATFIGEVLLVDFVSSRAGGYYRRILQAVVSDGGATINLKWFRGAESIARGLKKGQRVLVTGGSPANNSMVVHGGGKPVGNP